MNDLMSEAMLFALLSPATKWKGDIGLGVIRPSVIPSFRPSVCPEIVSGA